MTVFGIYKIKHLSLWSCLRIAPLTVVWTEQPDWALLIKGGVSRLPFELWCERRAVQPKQFIIIYTVYITWSVSLVTVMIKDAYYHLFICDTPQNKYVQWATLKSCTITLSRQNLHVNIKKKLLPVSLCDLQVLLYLWTWSKWHHDEASYMCGSTFYLSAVPSKFCLHWPHRPVCHQFAWRICRVIIIIWGPHGLKRSKSS